MGSRAPTRRGPFCVIRNSTHGSVPRRPLSHHTRGGAPRAKSLAPSTPRSFGDQRRFLRPSPSLPRPSPRPFPRPFPPGWQVLPTLRRLVLALWVCHRVRPALPSAEGCCAAPMGARSLPRSSTASLTASAARQRSSGFKGGTRSMQHVCAGLCSFKKKQNKIAINRETKRNLCVFWVFVFLVFFHFWFFVGKNQLMESISISNLRSALGGMPHAGKPPAP
jgi:hypothetical protein